MFRSIIIFCLLTVFSTSLTAQKTGYQVTGRIVDSLNQEPLVGVNVQLINQVDSTQRISTTDLEGFFSFEKTKPGNYHLKTSYLGYAKLQQKITVAGGDVKLATLIMVEKPEILKEVEVKGKIPPVEIEGDTVNYNSAAYKTNPDANAEDLIRKMPGITVENGKVQAQGEDVKRVLVDGREFFGNDPNIALRNLPAEIIDKIQVFDEQSEQAQFTGFDDGETNKTINIVTRGSMRNGQFGKVYGGLGTEHTYNFGGSTNIFDQERRLSLIGHINNLNQQNFTTEDIMGVIGNTGGRRRNTGRNQGSRGSSRRGNFSRPSGNPSDFLVGQQDGITETGSFGVNYTDNWNERINLSGSYFYNQAENKSIENLLREYFLEGSDNTLYQEDSYSNNRNANHRINFRVEYKLDSFNSIIWRPRLSLQGNHSFTNLDGISSLGQLQVDSETESNSRADYNGYNLSNSLLFRHRFRKRGRTFSTSLDYSLNSKNGGQYLFARNAFYSGKNPGTDSLNQNTGLDTKGYRWSGNMAYTEPLSEKGLMQFNYKISYSKSNSDRLTRLFNEALEAYSMIDTALSNVFKNDYLTQEIGGAIRFRRGLSTIFSAGGAFENASLLSDEDFPVDYQLRRNFNNFLPNFMLMQKLGSGKNIRFMYRAATDAPSINQLQEVIDNSNSLQLRTGNADLDQAYAHRLFLRYQATNLETMNSFFAMISGQSTKNYIGNETILAVKDTMISEDLELKAGGQLRRPANLDGYYNLRSFLTFGRPVKLIKSNLNLNQMISYSKMPGLTNGNYNFSHAFTTGMGMVISSNISENFDFTLSSNSNYTLVKNTMQSRLNNNYFTQSSYLKLNWLFWKGFVVDNVLNHQLYKGLADGFDQNYFLWNLSIAKKILKNRLGEIRLTAFDLLNENDNIDRNVTDAYLEDIRSNVLNRYFMLTFSYKFRNFAI